MCDTIKNGLKVLSNGLKKRLDPVTKAKVQVGYLNESLQRTETGVHQILNFIEFDADLGPKFNAYIASLADEKVTEAKESAAD